MASGKQEQWVDGQVIFGESECVYVGGGGGDSGFGERCIRESVGD